MMSVVIEGIQVEALGNTGATIFVIIANLCLRLRKVKTPYSGPCLRGANDNDIQPTAYCTVRISIERIRHSIQCAVISPCAHDLTVGWHFLASSSAVISCRRPAIRIADT